MDVRFYHDNRHLAEWRLSLFALYILIAKNCLSKQKQYDKITKSAADAADPKELSLPPRDRRLVLSFPLATLVSGNREVPFLSVPMPETGGSEYIMDLTTVVVILILVTILVITIKK